MRGVKPDKFEGEACNIYIFFYYSLPSLKPSLILSFEKESFGECILFRSSSVDDCGGRLHSAMKRAQLLSPVT